MIPSTVRERAGVTDLTPYWIGANGVRSREELCSIIRRECACVNRNGHRLSLILFHTEEATIDSTSTLRLALFIADRVRCIDEVGFLDAHCIGVALPYTDFEGGRKLADNILQSPFSMGTDLK